MKTSSILSPNQLGWLIKVPRAKLEDLANNAVRNYSPFVLRKAGKKPRLIDNPSKDLKNVQCRINQIVLSSFPFPEYVQGGVKGRSPYTNAGLHLGRKQVVRLDLAKFFPHVSDRQVYRAWVQRMGCSARVARLLTALTTYRGHLPQGAPTSTALANIVLLDVDEVIHATATTASITYSRYVDDLVFSGDAPQLIIGFVVGTLKKAGFPVSRSKLSIMPQWKLQEVAGLAVNARQRLSIPKKRRAKIRVAVHQLNFLNTGGDRQIQSDSIHGRIGHTKLANPGSARALLNKLRETLRRIDSQIAV